MSIASVDDTLAAIRYATTHDVQLRTGCVSMPGARLLALWRFDGEVDPAEPMAPLLTVGDVLAMVDAARDEGGLVGARDALAVAVTYLSALRPSELSSLTVDPNRCGLSSDGKLVLIFRTSKSQHWVREEIRGDRLGIAELWQTYRSLRDPISGDDPGGGLLVSPDGRRRVSDVSKMLRRAAARAGVRRFAPYSLRRSRATHAWMAGKPLAWVGRHVLRHAPASLSTDRYVECWRALGGREEAAQVWLDKTVVRRAPVPIEEVSSGRRRGVQRLAMVDASLDELLNGLDLAALTTTAGLVETSAAGLASSRRTWKRWAQYAHGFGADPLEPPAALLTLWLDELEEGAGLSPQTLRAYVRMVEVGWEDATGRDADAPMFREARGFVARRENAVPTPAGQVSEPASDQHVAEAIRGLPVVQPSLAWARQVISYSAGTAAPVRLVQIESDRLDVEVAGRRTSLSQGPGGMVCPLVAGRLLFEAGEAVVQGTGQLMDVVVAGLPVTVALRDRALMTFAAGSGSRPSDLSRARRTAVARVGDARVVWLSVSKDNRRGQPDVRAVRPDEPTFDAVGPFDAWLAWWPYRAGWLFPDIDPVRIESGDLNPMGSKRIGAALTSWLRSGGAPETVTAYGLRYRFAERAWEQGLPLDEIRLLMGHLDRRTTRGYIRSWTWFTDLAPENSA